MSTTVTYKGATIATADNQTKTLLTAGKYMEGDVTVTDANPNTRYVLDGTLDSLPSDLGAWLTANNLWDDFTDLLQPNGEGITATITIDPTLIGYSSFDAPLHTSGSYQIGVSASVWHWSGGITYFDMAVGMFWNVSNLSQVITQECLALADSSGTVTDMSPYAQYIGYHLVILRHPMPITP